MISDILSDAVVEIERYEREMPDVYAPIKDTLGALKAHMTYIRVLLDTPPDVSPCCCDCGGPILVTHETMRRNAGLAHLDEEVCERQIIESIADAVKRGDSKVKNAI